MTAETVVGAVPAKAEFRTCQYTGLKVDVAAQALITAATAFALIRAWACLWRSHAGRRCICCRQSGSISC